MSNGVKLEGFNEFKDKLNNASKKTLVNAHALVTDLAYKWQELAVKSVPVNHGRLKNGISAKGSTNLNSTTPSAEVYSYINYSPFMEWGTIERVKVPSYLQNYAMQFKGRGLRKRGGVFPRPFFFIHQAAIEAELKQRLKEVFDA